MEQNTVNPIEEKINLVEKKKNVFGIIGLVLGCVSLIFCLFGAGIYFAIPALILAILGVTFASKKNMKKGIALAALIVAIAGVLFGVVSLIACNKVVEEAVTSAAPSSDVTVPSDVVSEAVEKAVSDALAETKPADAKGAKDAKWEVGDGKATMYTDSLGTNWVQVKVPVKNTGNSDLYLSAGTMDLEDTNGAFVDTLSFVSVYPEVLCPGEIAWYVEETTVEFDTQELKVVPHVDVKEAKVDCVRLDVSEVSVSDTPYTGIEVKGRVENTTSEEQSFIYVVAFLYDADGELLTNAFDIIMDPLAAGDKIGFSGNAIMSDKDITADKVARYEIYAYPQQYQF